MKVKEFNDNLNKMSLEELKKEESSLKEELFNLRFKNATSPIENPIRLRYLKRDIARVKTAIKAKEIAENK